LAESRVSAFIQDHWQAGRTLTLDYDLRYEINRLPSPLPTTGIDFSPRLGFAWIPRPSLVVRGGFGLFYDRYLLSSLNRVLEFDGAHASAQIVGGPAAASLYGSGSLPASPLPGVAPSIWRSDPRLINPYSEVGSLSVEQALPLQTTLTAEYQFVHGVHLERTINSNLLPPVVLTPGNAASLGILSPTAQQLGRPVFTFARADPAYDAVNRFSTTADSNFNGATITLNRQFQDDFELLAGYIYSKTIDDASSDLEQPQNPFDLGAERTLSLLDQRHRFTLSGLWLIGPDLGDPADAARTPTLDRSCAFSMGLSSRLSSRCPAASGRTHSLAWTAIRSTSTRSPCDRRPTAVTRYPPLRTLTSTCVCSRWCQMERDIWTSLPRASTS